MLDLGEFLATLIPLPFGWGSVPLWSPLLGTGVGAGIGVVLEWITATNDAKRRRKPDYTELSARGSILSGRGQVAGSIIAAFALITSVYMWQDQRQEDARLQGQLSREEAQREELLRQAEEMRAHAMFVEHVAVLAYSDAAGMKIKIRNANSAAATVLVLSLVGDRNMRQNVQVLVSPCSQASFVMRSPTTWAAVVRKGGLDWLPGADPTPAPQDYIFHTFGTRNKKGSEEVWFVRFGASEEPINSCAS
ncbi:hypothetical protein AB0M95_36960 [Sphaerisporangium sp. NPDC051017]|uniref:hypothetical protein n=1 Tax=Sphaerisporangium sp. NPDC051017 TaxID=3154636 RepID=UPI0034365190